MSISSQCLRSLAILGMLLLSSALLPAPHVAADDFWSIEMTADAGSDGSNEFLEFGARSGATDGFDAGGVDIPSPPSGPGITFSAYFQISDPIFPLLNADYREMLSTSPGTSIVWNLTLDSTSQPITLTWTDPSGAGLPSDASLTLSGSGQTVDMRFTSSTTFPAGTHSLTITAAKAGTPAPTPTPTPTTTPPSPTTPSTNTSGTDEGDEQDGGQSSGGTDSTTSPQTSAPDYSGPLACTALSIEPAQALPGQQVTIAATVCNTGDASTDASVALTVDGVATETRAVSLSAGDCEQVVFTTSRASPGAYEIDVNGASGRFSVVDSDGTAGTTVAPPRQTAIDTTGIIILSAVILVMVTALIIVFKRR